LRYTNEDRVAIVHADICGTPRSLFSKAMQTRHGAPPDCIINS
jgi:hypothetical protein